MIGTANCVYETPCGWCSKWNKKCDKRIGSITDHEADIAVPNKKIDDLTDLTSISDKRYENRGFVSAEIMQKIQEFEKE